MSDGSTCPPFFRREPGAAQVPLHSTHLVSQLTLNSPSRTGPPLAPDALSEVGWTEVERGEEEDYEDVGEDEEGEQDYEDEGDDEEDGDDEGDEDGEDGEDGTDERDEDGEDEDGEDDEDEEYEDDDEEEESGEEADNPFEADVKAPDLPPVPQYASDLQSQKRSSRNDTAPIPYAEGGSMKTDLLDASMSVFDEILPHPVHDYSQQLQPDRASHTFFSEPPPYAAPEEVYVAPQPTEAFPSVFFQEPPVFNTAPPPYYIPPIFDVPPPYIGQTAPPEFYSPPQWANFKVVVQTEPIQPVSALIILTAKFLI
ncbi:hypothetical protein BDZ89DRAFT_237221 [Hymenopellis radicata]|nr:hypothetical protein BDZ89DRAFT_237221 [Hymenopellis radicata]